MAIGIVGQEIVDELQDDWNTIVGFVENLPNLAEGLVGEIVDGVEEGASIVGDLFTNPGAAVSAFESIGGDIVSVALSYGNIIGCDFGISTDCIMASSTINFIDQVSSSCSAILANPSYPPTYAPSYPATVLASTTYDLSSLISSYESLYATSYLPSSYNYGASPSYYSSAPIATAEGYSSSYAPSSYIYSASQSYYSSAPVATAEIYSSSYPETYYAYTSSPSYIYSPVRSSTDPVLPSAAIPSNPAFNPESNENRAGTMSWIQPIQIVAVTAVLALAFGMLLL